MFKTAEKLRRQKGFTLIEILFVIIVIAILAAIAIMRITTTRADAEAAACKANQGIMNTQIEQNQLDGNGYPADLAAFLVFLTNTTYFPDGVPVCPTTGTTTPFAYSATTYRMSCTTAGH